MNKSFHVVIPARMASERLPGKPLLEIQGIPMIIRVANSCIKAIGAENVTVSSPDCEIIEKCEQYGVQNIKSEMSCKSGTDRLYEFAQQKYFDKYINIQGDEPLLKPEIIETFIKESLACTRSTIGVAPIYDAALVQSESVVKIALSEERLVYASRSPLPVHSENGSESFYKHTGLYSFNHPDLIAFGQEKRGPLEIAENVEILRLIERGAEIHAVLVPNYGRAVDTQKDLDFVNKYGEF